MREALALALALLCGLAGSAWLAETPPHEYRLAAFTTTLEGRTRSQRHNAELGLEKLRDVEVPAGGIFSFNRTVGTWTRDAGYRKAPVSYNGQLIRSWGGGVCQTSTTLYNAALLAGMEIVERHRHTFQPGYAPPGRDAAVAFNSIDLRLRNPYPFPVRLRGRAENGRLMVEVVADRPLPERPHLTQEVWSVRAPSTFTSGPPGPSGRLRNSGKAGCEVAVYRVWRSRRELISVDSYPAMHRLVEYR